MFGQTTCGGEGGHVFCVYDVPDSVFEEGLANKIKDPDLIASTGSYLFDWVVDARKKCTALHEVFHGFYTDCHGVAYGGTPKGTGPSSDPVGEIHAYEMSETCLETIKLSCKERSGPKKRSHSFS